MRTEETGRAAGSQEVRHMVKRLALLQVRRDRQGVCEGHRAGPCEA